MNMVIRKGCLINMDKSGVLKEFEFYTPHKTYADLQYLAEKKRGLKNESNNTR